MACVYYQSSFCWAKPAAKEQLIEQNLEMNFNRWRYFSVIVRVDDDVESDYFESTGMALIQIWKVLIVPICLSYETRICNLTNLSALRITYLSAAVFHNGTIFHPQLFSIMVPFSTLS